MAQLGVGRSELLSDRGSDGIIWSGAVAALHEVAVAAGNLSEPDRLARVVVEKARVIGASDAAVLRWVDPATGVFRLVAASGTAGDPVPEIGSMEPTAVREAVASREPIIVNDYEGSGWTTSWGRTHGIEAQLAVPLLVQGEPRGALAVLSFGKRRYRTEDATFLSLLAAIVAPALEAGRLTQVEQERLGVIIDAQRQIANSEVDIYRLLVVLSERAVALTGAAGAAVLLPEKGQMVVKAAAGTIEIPLGFNVPIDASLAGLAFRTGEIQRAANARDDARVHIDTAQKAGLGAMVSAPLVTERGVVGVLQLMSEQPGGLDDADARTLQMIAGFAAAAFQRASSSQRMRDSERRVRAVIESAPDPIVVMNSDGEVVDFNPAAERAFLRRRSDMIGRSAALLIAARHIEAFQRWNKAGDEANSAEYAGRTFEATGRRSDATEFPMEIVITDLHEETRLVAAFLRDLTLRDAQRESEAKSRLIAMMNHEVRTPLNSILGFARLLKESSTATLNDKQRRYVENIEISGSHLLGLVNDSLDLARLENGRELIELVDVSAENVMRLAADQLRPVADARGLSLAVQSAPGLVVRADRRQLIQVLLNLVSNAIRHTHPGGSVTLSGSADGPEATLTVADTGDGISADDQGRLFEEFFQAGNHAPGGMGLGLAISRRLAQSMEASIHVQSDLGHGSAFSIRLARGFGGPD